MNKNRMNPVEVYIVARDAGLLLNKYSIVNFEEHVKDQLISGFLTALNNFARELDFPEGVSLIRSGTLEARFSPGKRVFSVLIIDYQMPLGSSTEAILSGLASEIVQKFEEIYQDDLEKQTNSNKYRPKAFKDFWKEIDKIIDQFGEQSYELYQKLVLIEALYAKVPQKWCFPLIERVGGGERVDILSEIPEMYHRPLKQAIKKVNLYSKPVWEIFVVPLIDPNSI
ncbi:MAG: hypothetical protein GF383_08425 [Candidatus Lokiarchaeota archaeon]|nr:hypothetical protein [Candidatus Lokiarchaeota archaeon]MBD3340381.1 hypothetical protein [Candidatus Lokiarchaeota archaeon]